MRVIDLEGLFDFGDVVSRILGCLGISEYLMMILQYGDSNVSH